MAQDSYHIKAMSPELVIVPVTMTGTGAAAPTKTLGAGVTLSRVSAGKVRLTFNEHVGTYVDTIGMVSAATPTATTTKWVQVEHDTYTAAGKTLDVYFTTPSTDAAAAALADLAATEKCVLLVLFRRSAV
jgi:hypothetical protein